MDTQVVVRNPVVFERDGKLWTTSLDVARVFEKEHKHVLEKIEELECSEEFSRSNFRLSEYRSDRGKTYPMIEMTETGFSFIAMGFTGAKAAQSTSSEETLKNPPPCLCGGFYRQDMQSSVMTPWRVLWGQPGSVVLKNSLVTRM